MATENRTPDDLQEAVAATLRRLRGEVGKPGAAPAPARVEPQLSAAAPQEPVPVVTPAVNQEVVEPDLLSRSQPEIPPTPASTLAGGAEQYRLETPHGRTRLLPYALSLIAVVVFAGIVWWAYQAIVTAPNKGPVPTIAADSSPAKVPPADQQSTDTTGQQQTVYDQISGTTTQPKTETLLPTPEAPQTPPPPPTPVPSTTDAGATAPAADSSSATQTLVPPPAPLAPATTGGTTAPATTSDTSTNTSTGGTSTGGATSADTSSGTASTTDAGSTATPPATGTDAGSAATGSAADTVTTNPSTDDAELYGVPMLAPTTATTPATSTTTTVASADTSGATQNTSVADNFHIQLAALKSEAEANQAWKRILAKHNDVLGSLTVHIVRADLGTQGIYYRVQAGPFADKASAAAVCDQLKTAGQQCLVKP